MFAQLRPLRITALVIFAAFSAAPMVAVAQSHAAAALRDININHGFADLVEAVKPAVVNISTTGRAEVNFHSSPDIEEFFRRFFDELPPGIGPGREPYQRKTTAVGSGFIIDPQGLVVTNYHVIEDADEIEVVFDDGTRLPATLRGSDEKTDLALLEIDSGTPLPFVQFGDSDAARVGDWVVAIGNPFGLGGTVTSGIISARGRDIQAGPLDDFIQIDAPINRGNSGGPLFNTRGEVIGVNSVIYSPNGGNVGIGFAIPASMASDVINQLRERGVVRRGFLGVQIQSVTEEIAEGLGLAETSGALVTRVVEDSPAVRAGIEPGDVILTYDGAEVTTMRELPKQVALTKKGTEVDIEVWRDEALITLQVAIGDNAVEVANQGNGRTADIGLRVTAVEADSREQYQLAEDTQGVVITAVTPDSPAAERGLRVGEVVRRVGNQVVNSPEQFHAAVSATRTAGKNSVLLLVERAQHTRFISVPLVAER